MVLVVMAVTACAPAGTGPERSARGAEVAPEWRRLPESPLSPRDHAVVVGVGQRVLVVGGWEFLCPPLADCMTPAAPLFADGAVYDADTDSWRSIAPAPFGVIRQEYATAAMDGSAYMVGCADGPRCDGPPRLLSYELASDHWTDHGPIPHSTGSRHLVPLGGALLAYSGSDEQGEQPDLVFDPAKSTWTQLPDDPLPRTFDRFLVATSGDLVLTGSSIAALDSGEDTTKLAARFDADSDRWIRLPDAPGQGYQIFPTDRGPLLNGHFIRSSGWILDPDSRTWAALPERTDRNSDLNGVLNRGNAVYDIPNSVGQMTSANQVMVYDSVAGAFVTIPALQDRAEVYDDSSTALGRDLFVYGGQRWSGEGTAGEGELVGDAWLWTAPAG